MQKSSIKYRNIPYSKYYKIKSIFTQPKLSTYTNETPAKNITRTKLDTKKKQENRKPSTRLGSERTKKKRDVRNSHFCEWRHAFCMPSDALRRNAVFLCTSQDAASPLPDVGRRMQF